MRTAIYVLGLLIFTLAMWGLFIWTLGGFGVLLVMLERPQIVTSGGFTGKRTKGGGEFWTPNIIGRTYRLAGHPGEGGGVSPRMHWRRGHWRAQAWGERHLLRKVIWIEPTLVAVEGESEQSDRSA